MFIIPVLLSLFALMSQMTNGLYIRKINKKKESKIEECMYINIYLFGQLQTEWNRSEYAQIFEKLNFKFHHTFYVILLLLINQNIQSIYLHVCMYGIWKMSLLIIILYIWI